MIEVMYKIPSEESVEEVIVTKECISEGAQPKIIYKQAS